MSLKVVFPGELLALCVPDRDVGPHEDLRGWRNGEGVTVSQTSPVGSVQSRGNGNTQPHGALLRGGGGAEQSLARGSARVLGAPLALMDDKGMSGVVWTGGGGGH